MCPMKGITLKPVKTIIIKSQAEFEALPESFDEYTIIEINSKEVISIFAEKKNSKIYIVAGSPVSLWDGVTVTAEFGLPHDAIVADEN